MFIIFIEGHNGDTSVEKIDVNASNWWKEKLPLAFKYAEFSAELTRAYYGLKSMVNVTIKSVQRHKTV